MGIAKKQTTADWTMPRWIPGILVLIFYMLSALPVFAFHAHDYRMAGDAARMRVVLNFDKEPEPHWFLLRGPHRLVVDLPKTTFAIDPKESRARGFIRNIRYGDVASGSSRLVLEASGPFTIDRLEILPNDEGAGFRLVADLVAASEKAFEDALAIQAATTGSTRAMDRPAVTSADKPQEDKRFTIVLDPGHGGADGGAEGTGGTVEKDLTLTFASELRDRLQSDGRYKVVMTREADMFLRLDERVRIAREQAADLFISIHADTIRLKKIRGATVYTVSERASDADAQALADRENLADKLGDVVVEEENHQVADILVDLIRRETHSFSMRFARTLVGELSTSVGLINNPHRFAGFKVLKAPDVPSVLVELGYLSNPKDEEQLNSAEWRDKAAGSILKAIDAFASSVGGVGG